MKTNSQSLDKNDLETKKTNLEKEKSEVLSQLKDLRKGEWSDFKSFQNIYSDDLTEKKQTNFVNKLDKIEHDRKLNHDEKVKKSEQFVKDFFPKLIKASHLNLMYKWVI